ncbi:MAG TPA: HAMP domain-containing sensor histidine kinase [Thermomicrobiales bacterium]|nr:HAMP domain-containing sensor histidine kinase [Thermomicrobiales bacterium]
MRTPLVAIKGLSQLMLRRSELSERSRSDVSRIVASVDRMNRLITDLVDFTRGRLGTGLPIAPAATDLCEVCRRCIEDVKIEHPHRDVHFNAEGDLQGEWDPDRLTQVVGNLVSNALKYSPAGSPVEVIARPARDVVSLQVRNHGEPIPQDEIDRIFDPFRRGSHESRRDQQGRGLGLGLSIVQQIVQAHGGTVDAQSSAEAGTVFTVRLPR